MGLRDLFHTKELYNKAWRESGDFIEYTPEELRQKQLDILEIFKDIQAVCNKHNLRMAFCGGTALGAVRHKGFIPWDDDMDVCMPRADIEKFKQIFEGELGDKYVLNCPNYSKNPIERFAKIIRKGDFFDEKSSPEIFLDIFTIENAPEQKIYQNIKGLFCNGIMFIASAVWQYNGGMGTIPDSILQSKTYKLKNFIGRCFSFIPISKWFNLVDKSIRQKKESGVSTMPAGRKHYNGEIIPSDIVFPFKEILYEDTKGYVFSDITAYLTHMYGPNYMTLPPEEKREKHYKMRK